MAEQLSPEEIEQEKIPSLEEQVAVYAEMFDVDVEELLKVARFCQAKMSENERREFSLLIYTPEGVDESSLSYSERLGLGFKYPRIPRNMDELASIGFTPFSQEPDTEILKDYTLSDYKRNKHDKIFISEKQGIIARVVYHRLTQKKMDETNHTIFLSSPYKDETVIHYIDSPPGSRSHSAFRPGFPPPRKGVRRIVSWEFGPLTLESKARKDAIKIIKNIFGAEVADLLENDKTNSWTENYFALLSLGENGREIDRIAKLPLKERQKEGQRYFPQAYLVRPAERPDDEANTLLRPVEGGGSSVPDEHLLRPVEERPDEENK